MVKIERIGNYIIVTEPNDVLEFPTQETRYREQGGNIDLINVQNNNMHTSYVWTDLVDYNSVAFGSLQAVLDWLRLNTAAFRINDVMADVALGKIDGSFAVNKFGANVDVGTTQEDVWDGGGTYPFPTTADITHLHQVSDQVALRGGEINIQGLDANWDLVVQNKNLDLTDTSTPVVLDTPLIRVFRMKVQENVIADSDIHVNNLADTIQYATMTAGNNQTLMAIYTVPAGKVAIMTSLFFSNIDVTNRTPTSIEIRMWAADRTNDYGFQLKYADAMPEAGSGRQHKFLPYYKFNEKTDIKLSAQSADQPGHVHAGFDLIITNA